MIERGRSTGDLILPASPEVYSLMSWIEGTPDRMNGIVRSDFLQMFVEVRGYMTTLYAQLGAHQYAQLATVTRRGSSALIEHGHHERQSIGNKVPLATVEHDRGTALLLGVFQLLDVERDYTREYSLTAQIQDYAPGVRWLQGNVSSLGNGTTLSGF